MLILESNMSNLLRRWRASLLRLAGLIRKGRTEQDLADEFASHLQMHIDDNLRRGMTSQEARRQALIKLGGIEPAKEIYRDRRGVPVLETVLKDLHYGLRTLRKNPGFTAVAVTTLALGIAANTTIFSVVSAILLKKPPITDPDRTMVVASTDKSHAESYSGVAVPDYIAWREQSHVFQTMAASTYDEFTLTGGTEPQRLLGLRTTADYFQVLSVPAAMGRTFLPGDDQPGHEHVIVLSHRLWQSRFNADPTVIGTTVPIDGERYTVIGVMPAKFRLNIFDAALWTPLIFTPEQLSPAGRADRSLNVVARLKPGISPEQAQTEMATIAHRLEETYPETNKNRSARVMSLQEFMILDANVRSAFTVLMGAVVFVLLIACSNIANLLLARNAVRQRELVIRAALGAGRLRLVRQLLVESLLIGAIGGGLGFLLAVWGTTLLRALLTWNDYVQIMASQMVLDRPVLEFCLLLSMLAAIFFGLLPALQASKPDLNAILNEGARGGSSGVARRRLRSTFVVGEIALSIVLLVGSGVLIQSVFLELRQSLGLNPQHVLTATVRVTGHRYKTPQEQAAFFRAVVEHARSLPGVEQASAANALPLSAFGRVNFRIEGQSDAPKSADLEARHYVVGPEYFQVMGIGLLKGRGFLASDSNNAPLTVVVNETFAQRFFAGQDPIGRRILIGPKDSETRTSSEMVGVVANVRDFLGQSDFEPQIYECYLQRPEPSMTIVVKANADLNGLVPLLRQSIWSVDKDQPIGTIQTMTKVIVDRGAADRLMGWLMGTFAGLALVLAAVGIFGVIAYNVAQRTREVGIRMALGAGKRDVLRLVVGQAAVLTAIGVGIGLLGAFPLTRLLQSAFEGIPMDDVPQLLAGVAVLVAGVSLLASYVPARRAMGVEPTRALRQE
jgi:predicted permease